MIKLLRPFEHTSMALRLSFVMLVFHFLFVSYLFASYFAYYDGEFFFHHFVALVYAFVSFCVLFISVVPMMSVDCSVMFLDIVYDRKFNKIHKSTLLLAVAVFSIFEIITYFVCSILYPIITFGLSAVIVPFYIVIIVILASNQWRRI